MKTITLWINVKNPSAITNLKQIKKRLTELGVSFINETTFTYDETNTLLSDSIDKIMWEYLKHNS